MTIPTAVQVSDALGYDWYSAGITSAPETTVPPPPSRKVPAGHVIAQTPVGQVLHRGDTVSLTVSRGPQLVPIPSDLKAEGVQAAAAELHALGFNVVVEHSDFYLGLGFVASSSPSPGSMAPQGSTVTLRSV